LTPYLRQYGKETTERQYDCSMTDRSAWAWITPKIKIELFYGRLREDTIKA